MLEIGTGSGYQACILAVLGARVITIERNKKLYQRTKKLLPKLTKRLIIQLFGDGYYGAPTYGPFDKVIITAAAPYIPPLLLDQLNIGGVMVAPVGSDTNGWQNMLSITKVAEGKYEKQVHFKCKFVPILKGKQF